MNASEINAAILVSPMVVVPPGTHTLEAPIIIGTSQLVVCDGCRFAVAHTGPGIVLNGRWAELRGGRFDFPSDTAGPLLRITDAVSVRVSDCMLRGGSMRLATGIEIGGTLPTYFANVSRVSIGDVGTGVRLGFNANACQVRDCFLERLQSVAFDFDNAIENRIEGGFVHGGGGADGVVVVRMKNASLMNYVAISAEPGGSARGYDIDAGCDYNQLICQLNCGGGLSDTGKENLIVRLGSKRNF